MKWGEEIPAKFDLSLAAAARLGRRADQPRGVDLVPRASSAATAPRSSTPGGRPRPARIMISPLPGVTAAKPGSAQAPLPGIAAEVVDDEGESVPNGGGGYLVLTEPWPSMLRSIWGDAERYKETYWSRFDGHVLRRRRREEGRGRRHLAARPGRRRHERLRPPALHHRGRVGAGVAPEGRRGRGRRRHRRDHRPGRRAPSSSCAATPPDEAPRTLVQELRNHVAKEIGPIAKPRQILIVAELPKTRSGKIMRRLLQGRRREPRGRRRHHPGRLLGDGPDPDGLSSSGVRSDPSGRPRRSRGRPAALRDACRRQRARPAAPTSVRGLMTGSAAATPAASGWASRSPIGTVRPSASPGTPISRHRARRLAGGELVAAMGAAVRSGLDERTERRHGVHDRAPPGAGSGGRRPRPRSPRCYSAGRRCSRCKVDVAASRWRPGGPAQPSPMRWRRSDVIGG